MPTKGKWMQIERIIKANLPATELAATNPNIKIEIILAPP